MVWTILGISVAILAVFCISVAETLVGTPIFEDHRQHIAGAFAAVGMVVWLTGGFLARWRRAQAGLADEPGRRFVLFDLRYWGPMLMALGLTTLFIRPLRPKTEPVAVAVAASPLPKETAVATPHVEEPPPKRPASFPRVKLQGVFYGAHSSAIINGNSYSVGDHFGEVVVKSIERGGVVLELAGETRTLPFY